MGRRVAIVFCLTGFCTAVLAAEPEPTRDEVIAAMKPFDGRAGVGIVRTTLIGRVLCGYQGWFAAEGDGSGRGWRHYTAGEKFEPGSCSIDLWPDLSEGDVDERFETLFRHADGRVAHVFSSSNRKTVLRHFQWMQEYGIDGVFVQRFAVETVEPQALRQINTVLAHCREGANRHGRVYAVMYDLTGLAEGGIQTVIDDWKLLVDRMRLGKDKNDIAYQHHNGKPLVGVWGIGFNDDRKYTLAECERLIDFLKDDPQYGGFSVVIGVPNGWRTLDADSVNDPALHRVIAKADVVSPWTVGRYASPADIDSQVQNRWKPDREWCAEHKLDYLPVLFPGFSWHNLNAKAPLDQIPRQRGRFLWKQFVEARNAGASMAYVAMFDEMDEGTAIFKCTNDVPVGASPFVTFDGLPSDHYLWLTGQGRALLQGRLPASAEPPARNGGEGGTDKIQKPGTSGVHGARQGFVVIAPDALHLALQEYLKHKQKRFPTELVSLEAVLKESPGVDDPERVKRFLFERWQKHAVGYALLVGDADLFPVRYMVLDRVTPAAFDYAFYPSDLYYSDLARGDGTFDDWNARKEGFHAGYFGEVRGEKNKSDPMNFDDVDYRPDMAVGRWPVSGPEEVAIVAAKTIAYENGLHDEKRAGLKAATLFSVGGWVDSRNVMDQLAGRLPADWKIEKRYFADRRRNDQTPPPTEPQLLALLDAGQRLVYHAGHGFDNAWDRCFTMLGVDRLKNADRLPVIISAGCSTARLATLPPYEPYMDVDGKEHAGTNAGEIFDAPPPPPAPYQKGRFNPTGLGEQLLRRGPNGAVAYIGCNTGSQPCGLTLLDGFSTALAAEPNARLGDCWAHAVAHYYDKEQLARLVPTKDWYPASIFFQGMKFMLYGDPTLPMGVPGK